jgi:hypothetical protein
MAGKGRSIEPLPRARQRRGQARRIERLGKIAESSQAWRHGVPVFQGFLQGLDRRWRKVPAIGRDHHQHSVALAGLRARIERCQTHAKYSPILFQPC